MPAPDDPNQPHVQNEDRYAPIPEALLYDADISADAVRVYGVLRRHGDDPSNCYPSQARIAGLIGRAPRSINGWLRQLESAGWIERVPRFTEAGDLDSNGYRVFLVRRAGERGVRAGERGPVRAGERGGYALESAINESQSNESQEERVARTEPPNKEFSWQVPAVVVDGGFLDEAVALCEHWAERLEERGVKVGSRARSKAWVTPMEAMLRIDERDADQVRRVIDWLEDGRGEVASFWRVNVLSPDKLRARWDQIGQQVRRERERRAGRRDGQAAAAAEYMRAAQQLAGMEGT